VNGLAVTQLTLIQERQPCMDIIQQPFSVIAIPWEDMMDVKQNM